jgi:hypothetical protein
MQGQALDAVLASEVSQHLGQRVRAVEVGVAIGGEDEEPKRAGGLQEVAEEQERWLPRRVEVVEDEDHGRALGEIGQQAGGCLEQAVAFGLRVVEQAGTEPGNQLLELRHDREQFGPRRTEELGELTLRGGIGQPTERFGEWLVRSAELLIA